MNVKKKDPITLFCVCMTSATIPVNQTSLFQTINCGNVFPSATWERKWCVQRENRLTMLHSLQAAICCHQHLTLNCDVSETMTHAMKLFWTIPSIKNDH